MAKIFDVQSGQPAASESINNPSPPEEPISNDVVLHDPSLDFLSRLLMQIAFGGKQNNTTESGSTRSETKTARGENRNQGAEPDPSVNPKPLAKRVFRYDSSLSSLRALLKTIIRATRTKTSGTISHSTSSNSAVVAPEGTTGNEWAEEINQGTTGNEEDEWAEEIDRAVPEFTRSVEKLAEYLDSPGQSSANFSGSSHFSMTSYEYLDEVRRSPRSRNRKASWRDSENRDMQLYAWGLRNDSDSETSSVLDIEAADALLEAINEGCLCGILPLHPVSSYH